MDFGFQLFDSGVVCPMQTHMQISKHLFKRSEYSILSLYTFMHAHLQVKWGVLDDYEVTQKIGRGKYSNQLSFLYWVRFRCLSQDM